MSESKLQTDLSRRRFMKTGGVLLVGGLVGCDSIKSSTPPESTAETPKLPWAWQHIDPMEAGTRAYHHYLDGGG